MRERAALARATAPISRASRTPPRNTDSNAPRHWSSVIDMAGPAGGPPTLIRAPSSRPQRSCAAAISRAGVSASALSATTVDHGVAVRRDATCVERLRRAAGHHDPGTLGDEDVERGPAEPAGSPGDDEDAVGESQVHAPNQNAGYAGTSWANWVR